MSSCSCTERCKHKNLCSLWRLSYCEEIPVEENEVNDSSSKSSMEAKPEASPQLPKKSVTASTLTSTGSSEAPASVSGLPPLQWHHSSFFLGFHWQPQSSWHHFGGHGICLRGCKQAMPDLKAIHRTPSSRAVSPLTVLG